MALPSSKNSNTQTPDWNPLSSFFIFCSGVYPTLLKRSPSEIQKYVGIGATIFFTGILAFISSSYALFTVFDSYLLSLIIGFIWGLMIFNLDRYLVSSMRKSNSKFKDFLGATPRILLAVLIAMVISKPLEVKLFDTEIQSELVLMEQERYRDQEKIAKSRYEDDINAGLTRIDVLNSKLESEKSKVDILLADAIAEADGTGGSGLRNMGPIYKMKKAEADLALDRYNGLKDSLYSRLLTEQSLVEELRAKSSETLASLDETALTGLASRINALSRMASKNSAIYWASIFIMLLFIAIECAPLLVKLITHRGPYDHMLAQLESKYKIKSEKQMVLSNLDKEVILDYARKTKMTQSTILIEAENEIYKAAIQNTKEDVLGKKPNWRDIKDGVWLGHLSEG